jgi:hypothetical protein
MDKCDNCVADATFINRPATDYVQFFCDQHVPWFLKDRIAAGNLERANQVEVVEEVAAPAPKTTRKKKAAVLDEQQQDTENTDEAGTSSSEIVD